MTSPDPDPQATAARTAAEVAAAQANVRIELVDDIEGLKAAAKVVDEVWGPGPEDRPVSVGLLRAMTHAGNYCAVAVDDRRAVGVCVGFVGLSDGLFLHSHVTGALREYAGRHIGRALKLDQRAWSLERGIRSITWTYDPLVRRNAFVNVRRLGALPLRYLTDFYGDMNDSINAGQHTDRLVVQWPLDHDRVRRLCGEAVGPEAEPRWGEAQERLSIDASTGGPVVGGPSVSPVQLVGTPVDVERMRRESPALALDWRLAMREVLGGLMAEGWSIRSFTDSGYYVLEQGPGGQ